MLDIIYLPIAMKTYIFGYGSLIVPESATKTLGRKIYDKDVLLGDIKDYSRLWNLVVQVILHNQQSDNIVNAVFLNIQKHQGKVINGALLQVTENELIKLDIREKQYQRIDITNNVLTYLSGESVIFTYVGKSEFLVNNYTKPRILKEYLNVIERIQYWGKDFYDRFNSTTEIHNFEILNGTYKFLDEQQNLFTGHT
jgi:hypothetical protein